MMFAFDRVTHENRDETRKTLVLDQVSLAFREPRRVALLGGNGAGKSTVLRLLSGVTRPDAGRIRVAGTVSWPVGFSGSFSSHMTGAENVRFLARLYGRDPEALTTFVERFADIGPAYHAPWRTYSSGQRSRVSMGASMGIPFDLYLVDEATSVGDAAFRAKADAYLRDRLRTAGAVIVSHANETVRQLCDCALVLNAGRMTFYEDLDAGIAAHEARMRDRVQAASPAA